MSTNAAFLQASGSGSAKEFQANTALADTFLASDWKLPEGRTMSVLVHSTVPGPGVFHGWLAAGGWIDEASEALPTSESFESSLLC